MPKRTAARAGRGGAAPARSTTAGADAPATPSASPVDAVRNCADALFRAAEECCHQHDRISRILARSTLEVELAVVRKTCELCDRSLRDIAQAYATTSASVHPTGMDEAWWRAANALWLASREFLRRHRNVVAAHQPKQHGPDQLGALHADNELEASAQLSLRHAADAYRRARPAAA